MSALIRSQNVRAIHHTDSSLKLTYGQTGRLGGNLMASTDYGVATYFADCITGSRGFCYANNNYEPVKVDAHGWPTEACINVLTAAGGPNTSGNCELGVHYMSYDATPSDNTIFSNFGSGSYTIVPTGSTANANGDITYYATITINSPSVIILQFSSGIRNAKVTRPGVSLAQLDAGSRYFYPMIKYISRLGCLRWMEALYTNRGNAAAFPDGTWANRTTLNTRGNSRGGLCFEDVIAISNAAKAEPGSIVSSVWVNTVCTANDDYIRQFATMLRDTLDPNIIIYFELGNEIWNSSGGFTGGNSYFNNLGAVDNSLSYDGTQAALNMQQRAYAKRVRQAALIIESVFGNLNTRIRVLLGCQTYDSLDKLQYLEYTYTERAPGSYLYATTGAPYYGLGDKTLNGMTATQAIAEIRNVHTNSGDQTFPTIFPPIMSGKAIATAYGIKLFGYEGGPGWDRATTTENALTAYTTNFEPTMTTLVSDAITGGFDRGMDLFNFFTVGPGINTIGANGNWSGNQSFYSVDPKLQGVLNVMTTAVSTPANIISNSKIKSNGTSTIDVIYKAKVSKNKAKTDQSWYGPYGPQYNLFYNFILGDAAWIDWGIYVESAGNYNVTVNSWYNTLSKNDPQIIPYTVLVDDVLVGTIQFPSALYPWSPQFLSIVPTRTNSTVYAEKALIKDPSNATQVFICTSAGVSDSTVPVGYASAISTTPTYFVDGSAVFQVTTNMSTGPYTPGLDSIPVTMALPQGWHKLRLNIATTNPAGIGVQIKSLSFTKV